MPVIGDPVLCGPEVSELTGVTTGSAQGEYLLLPFEVPTGTARVEVGYYAPTAAEQDRSLRSGSRRGSGVLDLGLWDASGTSGPEAFRFWSGNRQGRLDRGMDPIVVSADTDSRTVVAGKVEPGIWHVELGVAWLAGPSVWRVEVRCPLGDQPEPLAPDRADASLVADPEPGWYAADFHLHGYHSSPDGPDPEEMVELARSAGLDIVPVTEYVTPAHWDRLGRAQRDNPDLLLWPGREVITYQGHLVVLGETPGSVEYRLGHEGTTLGDIQRAAADAGALVSLAHPTLFPPDVFGNTCRGCFLEAIGEVDWESTELIEVVTEGAVAEFDGQTVPNPFVDTAVELWEEQLRLGNRLTAVSGSDDKSGDNYGSTLTMVWAPELSRTAVDAALRSGHAYVRALGADSPTIDIVASAPGPDGGRVRMGDTLVADSAEMTVTVSGGDGMTLALRRDGSEVERIPIDGPEFEHSFTITRDAASGPLGTFWGVEVLDADTVVGTELRSVIANPVFMADSPAAPIRSGQPAGYFGTNGTDPAGGEKAEEGESGPRTNGGTAVVILLTVSVVAMGIGGFLLARRHFPTDAPPD